MDITAYLIVILCSILTLFVLTIHVIHSDHLPKRNKIYFYITNALISIAALSEFFGVYLNGNPNDALHIFAKLVEFLVAPSLGVVWTASIAGKRYFKCMIIFIVANAVIQIISVFTGYIFYIDTNHIYQHGPCYFIYVIMYGASAATLLFYAIIYEIKNQGQMAFSLLGLIAVGVTGIVLQFINSSWRFCWLGISISSIFLYVYYTDLLLVTDELTGLLNRKAYEIHLKKIRYKTGIIFLDINGFKDCNDTFGHIVGDEILKEVSYIIKQTFGLRAFCYRIGGDEFCVIFKKTGFKEEYIDQLKERFLKLVYNYRENDTKFPCVAIGTSIYYGVGDIEQTIAKADEMMYKDKRVIKRLLKAGDGKNEHN